MRCTTAKLSQEELLGTSSFSLPVVGMDVAKEFCQKAFSRETITKLSGLVVAGAGKVMTMPLRVL